MFDWQNLRYFLAVARLGSFTAAARELGADHATVGRRIARLEESIGRKLVVRLPRATSLTEEGKVFAKMAEGMGREAESLLRSLRHPSEGMAGQVTISILPAFASCVLVPRLPEFRKTCPGIHLVLSATSEVSSLERGEADLSVGFVRSRKQGRIVRKIADIHFAFYGTAAFSGYRPDACPLIGFEDSLGGIPQQSWLDQHAHGRPFVLRSNDVQLQAASARMGIGVALLPCLVGDSMADLHRLPVEQDMPTRPLWMSVCQDVRTAPTVRAVMDCLMNVFS